MESVINITLPFFALIGCGWWAGKKGILGEAGVKGVNAFVFYFALPCLLFRAMATRPLGEIIDPVFLGGFAFAGLSLFALAAVAGRLFFKANLGVMGLMGQAATVSNTGFLGIPLISALLGPDALVPIVLTLLVDLLLLVPLSMAMNELNRGEGGHILRDVLKGLLVNAFVLSILAGLLWSATGLKIPGPVDTFTSVLGAAAGPAALFALGATLAGRPIAEGFRESSLMTACKLFIHPLAVWLVIGLWLDYPPLWSHAALMVAALPIAGNVFIIAQRFELYVARTSTAILISTALAVVTFSVLTFALGY